ncbi:MAG: tRNA-dihydrouridine synthase family protein [Polyangiaceae bacterium]|nr:tRNA-dihydrouridine synthase family protein [Polyangiaceae bacterium]
MNQSSAPAFSAPQRFPWQPNTFFAPMEGVTHPNIRELIAAKGGVGIVCTEFVRVTSNPLGRKILEKHVVRPSRGALSVQVMGNDIDHMADATALVTDAGADIVDINLGCPAPRAVRKGVGSAMLKDLDLLARVLDAMRERSDLPMSAKIRAGFDDSSRVLDVARTVEKAGFDFISVHPRRRVDFYQGVADWRIIRTLSQELSIPVVGNGDIWYAADALRMQKETGCSAVMLGRPVLRNPWIFQQIADLQAGRPPLQPSGAMVLEHVRDLAACLERQFPGKSALGMMKEQMRYLARAIDDGGVSVRDACRQQSMAELLQFTERRFGPLSNRDLDLAASGGRLERSGSAIRQPEIAGENSKTTTIQQGVMA